LDQKSLQSWTAFCTLAAWLLIDVQKDLQMIVGDDTIVSASLQVLLGDATAETA